jgi:hypothetical protein
MEVIGDAIQGSKTKDETRFGQGSHFEQFQAVSNL